MTKLEKLALDLYDGFEEDFSYQKLLNALQRIIEEKVYTIEELWEMNNNDSTDVYDLISDYYED